MFENQFHAPFSQRWALMYLTVSIIILSIRYHTSVSFEHPVHLTIVALVLTGLSLASIARWHPQYGRSLAVFQDQDPRRMHSFSQLADARRTSGVLRLRPNNAAVRLLFLMMDRARRLHSSFYLLIPCVALRTWLHWATIRTSQCFRAGLEAFLPFATLVLEAVGPLGISTPDLQLHDFVVHGSRLSRLSLPPKTHMLYAVSSLAWPVLAVLGLDRSGIATGTVCPVGHGWWEVFVPHMQLAKCGFDAVTITHCAHLIRNAVDDEVDMFKFMGALSLTAGGCVLMLSLPGWLGDAGLGLAVPSRFRGSDVWAVLLDGTLLASATVCATNLLSVLHSSAFALFVTSVGFVASQADQLGATAYLSPSRFSLAAERSTLVMAVAAPLLYLTRHLPNVSKSFVHPSIHKWLIMAYVGVVSVGVVCWLWISVKAGPSDLELGVAVEKLVSDAVADAGRWEAQASRSKTLAEAVAEYERRYGILPPPNFDKWYEFANERKSAVIDDFGQIHDDLLPFWGEQPASLREKTAGLLSLRDAGIWGLRVRNGTVQPSPDISEAQRWMAEAFEGMLGPFVRWLPDMDFALNLAKECRMAVPFRDMQRIRVRALKNRALAGSTHDRAQGFPEEYAEHKPGKDGGSRELAMTRVHGKAFYAWVIRTCPSKSRALTSRWWDWALTCADCSRPHSIETSSGPLVENVPKALDPCHQADLAQGRVRGFSDILIPSAWDFVEKDGHEDETGWGEKKNDLLWRGPPLDRVTTPSRLWAGSVQWRFVHEAHSHVTKKSEASFLSAVGINVSFTGGQDLVHLCDGALCQLPFETATQPSVGIEEHWQYRHLMDLGKTGSRGRSLAFLRSESLPYRAVRLRMWYEERLQAWHHYVPVDVRLGAGFWAALGFLGSNGDGGDDAGGDDAGGDGAGGTGTAEKMARQGREWAGKALRREDMQIYMFRLLLEWGRIVHDERERLGFLAG